ncbi:MAG: hypothetical protein AAF567_09485 [Actinomycetota bacterium]
MSRARFGVGQLLVVVFALSTVVSCGRADAEQGIAVPLPPAPEGPTTGDLGSFFRDDDVAAQPAETPRAEATPVPDPTAAPVPIPTAEKTPGSSASSMSISTGPPDAVIQSEPASVVLVATHQVEIRGSGLAADDDLIVVACEIPGDPIDRSTSAPELVERVLAADVADICDFDRSVRVIVDADGAFSVGVDVEVGPATVVLAGPTDGTYSVMTPIYLGP